jgi:hypothetical protein
VIFYRYFYRLRRVSLLKAPSLQQLRRYTIARSLFKPTSLPRAIARLGPYPRGRDCIRGGHDDAGADSGWPCTNTG